MMKITKRLAPIFLAVAINLLVLKPGNTIETITEADVTQLLEKVEKALDENNFKEALKYVAPFIYSQITIKTDSITQIIELNGVEEHRIYLEKRAQKIKQEKIRDYDQINILPGEKMAIINSVSTRSITDEKGRRLFVIGEGKVRLGIIDGELKIISTEEIGDVDLRP